MPVRHELVGVQVPDRPRIRWRFGEPDCPLRLASTPTGLGGAPLTNTGQSNARQPGRTFRGQVRDYNPIKAIVRVGPVEPGAVALDLWNDWRESLGTGNELAEWHVHSPRGGDRFQYVRLDKDIPDPDFAALEWLGEVTEEANLASDFSYWNGKGVEKTFTPANFAGAKTIKNLGDVDSWAYYEVTGPGTFTLGVDGETVILPALAAGETWHIDTDYEAPYVRNAAGVDKQEALGVKAWFKPVPANATTTLTVNVTGSNANTRALVKLPGYYTRAAA